MEPEPLQDVVDSAFAGISQAREAFVPQLTPREVGTITSIATGIAKVSGLPGVGFEEVLKFPGDVYGIAFNVDADEIGAVLLGDYWRLDAGDEVERQGHVVDVPVGDGLIGRIINPMGRPLDGKGPVVSSARLPVERPAAPIMDRAPVTVPLQTGIKVIDALIPVGRGQRELILGDRQTGKTAVALDTILNQRGQDVLCVYCAIGQRASGVAKVIANLREKGAMEYTIVVVTEGNDPPGLAYIAPYAATSIAEYFMEQGRDVLIVYDDLTHHARAYRELSLLLRRPPGREAFPGDIFYIHSRLLERATHLRPELGGGSLTHHRNRGAGHFRLHPDQPDLHHRRAGLPLAVAVRAGRAARRRCQQIRFARRRQGATRGLSRGGGRPQARLRPVRGAGNLCPLRRPTG
jgi:F-type H+-transporting ATPase subunit alpha